MRFIILLLPLLLIGCSNKNTKQKSLPVYPVKVAEAVKEDVPIFSSVIGHVEPITVINVQSRVEGTLMKTYFKEGSVVKKGELLFLIDPRPYEANLNKSKSAYDQTVAELRLSEDKVKRFAPLVKEDYYSQNDFDTLVQNNASNNAKLKGNQADIESSSLNLEYCYIYAPINGLAGIAKIDTGNMVYAIENETLITVNQLEPIYVNFFLPENQLQRLFYYKKKNPIKIQVMLDDPDETKVIGELNLINNEVNTSTGMVTIRGEFENKDHLLWPGEFVKTRLIYTVEKDAVVIPSQAIQSTPSGHTVYVIKQDNTAEMRIVKMGQRENGNIIIEKGVVAGEKVVVQGQLNLSQGSKVNIKED